MPLTSGVVLMTSCFPSSCFAFDTVCSFLLLVDRLRLVGRGLIDVCVCGVADSLVLRLDLKYQASENIIRPMFQAIYLKQCTAQRYDLT